MAFTLANFPQTPRFGALPPEFYTRLNPTPLPDPVLVAWNSELAEKLGLHTDPQAHPDLAHLLAGNQLPEGASPLASVYSGHQFGTYVPQLGDGRALLIGEHRAPDGEIYELQLKGAGLTPYSRMGDGRAVLRSSIREYLCSEAMQGLGIPTTRALGLVSSPQPVWREELETAAVVLRVAPTFVRFGHFEYFHRTGDHASLRILTDWVITHFYPQCRDEPQPYAALLLAVAERTAQLIARWQSVGFCHGVLNSDNMSILGLTLDYGPFGFLDGFDAGHICNHSDHTGRYAWHHQPEIGLWNLHCLAQALLPLADKEALTAALQQYQSMFESAFANQLRQKLGLVHWQEDDWNLVSRLLEMMQQSTADWTLFWRALANFDAESDLHNAKLRNFFIDRPAFDAWSAQYRARLDQEHSIASTRAERMNRVNPLYVLRNHLAESAIREAVKSGNFTEIERLQRCLAHPFEEQNEFANYAAAPPDWAQEISVSCSS
ncbi:MAG: YdiU family protein [Formivibrio sp.]|nr:YdiU family protein [Formivibrio sp.]